MLLILCFFPSIRLLVHSSQTKQIVFSQLHVTNQIRIASTWIIYLICAEISWNACIICLSFVEISLRSFHLISTLCTPFFACFCWEEDEIDKILWSSQSFFLREFASQKLDLAWFGGKSRENNVFVFAINNAKSDYWWFMELKKHFAAEFITKFNSASDASSAEVTVLYSIICLAMNWMFASLIIVFDPLLSSMVAGSLIASRPKSRQTTKAK